MSTIGAKILNNRLGGGD